MKEAAKHRKEKLYEDLKRGILTMELRPGSDLDETRLSESYGLSRTPLREVFRQLAGEGYTTIHQNRGARVSEMSHTTLRDFFLTAPMIYGAILRLAAQNATSEQILKLKKAQADFCKTLQTGSVKERALANNRFHDITGEMANNVYLEPSFNRLLIDHVRISMTFYKPVDAKMAENLDSASQQHDAIVKSIETKNEAAAAQLAIDHWNLSRDQIEMFVMPGGLDEQLGNLSRAKPA